MLRGSTSGDQRLLFSFVLGAFLRAGHAKTGLSLQFLSPPPAGFRYFRSIPCAAKKWHPCHFLALRFCKAKTYAFITAGSLPAACKLNQCGFA
jgi:hypothetical protein